MGRAPCCERMGLKKGPWTAEEDFVLVNYINQNGHGNWRALPKRAGLLRCGKSCRLRWMNYLRPDIKRGNFTGEEEEEIIKLHQELGNRWSVIAARLPGRTDNEIKNVWHTHLKKRINKESSPKSKTLIRKIESPEFDSKPNSPVHSSTSGISSVTTNITASGAGVGGSVDMISDSFDELPEIDESFWSEIFLTDDYSSAAASDSSSGGGIDSDLPFSTANSIGSDLKLEGEMNFWYELFERAEEMTIQLPQF